MKVEHFKYREVVEHEIGAKFQQAYAAGLYPNNAIPVNRKLQ